MSLIVKIHHTFDLSPEMILDAQPLMALYGETIVQGIKHGREGWPLEAIGDVEVNNVQRGVVSVVEGFDDGLVSGEVGELVQRGDFVEVCHGRGEVVVVDRCRGNQQQVDQVEAFSAASHAFFAGFVGRVQHLFSYLEETVYLLFIIQDID
nr:hypothetical protein Iba_chr13dCG2330 [Ipomoea batatas]